MDKVVEDLARTFSEIVGRRDARLPDRGISPVRLERLRETLASEFPLETALQETARRRDRALSLDARRLPADMAVRLLEEKTQGRSCTRAPRYFAQLLVRLRSALRGPEAIGAAMALLLVAGLLSYETPNAADKRERRGALVVSRDLRNAEPPHHNLRADRFLAGPGSRLALGVSRNELAQSRPALLIANRAFSPDLSAGKLDLRLDLPVSQILTDAGRSEMP